MPERFSSLHHEWTSFYLWPLPFYIHDTYLFLELQGTANGVIGTYTDIQYKKLRTVVLKRSLSVSMRPCVCCLKLSCAANPSSLCRNCVSFLLKLWNTSVPSSVFKLLDFLSAQSLLLSLLLRHFPVCTYQVVWKPSPTLGYYPLLLKLFIQKGR